MTPVDDALTEDAAVLPGVADPERLALLDDTGLRWETSASELDRFARLTAALLDVPVAYVTLVDADRQLSPGSVERDVVGAPTRAFTIGESICKFQVLTGERLVIRDARADRLTARQANVLDGRIGSYVGTPLRAGTGYVLGSLCAVDREPREWTEEQIVLLDDLAELVSGDLERRLHAARLGRTQEVSTRLATETQVLLDVVSGLVDLTEQADAPAVQRYAARTRVRSQRVRDLVAELAESAPAPRVEGGRPTVEMRRAVERAVRAARDSTGTTDVDLDLAPAPLVVACDRAQMERALAHLLVSALHHASVSEPLRVTLAKPVPERAELTLEAAGAQIPAAELARIVARFHGAGCDRSGTDVAPAALRMLGGAVRAQSGPVSATSSREGVTFRAEWALERPSATGRLSGR